MSENSKVIEFQEMVGAKNVPVMFVPASRGGLSVRTSNDKAWCTCAYSPGDNREGQTLITAAALNIYSALSQGEIEIANPAFVELVHRADCEVIANASKGDYADWQPGPDDLVSEIHYHADKLLAASDSGDLDEIKEYLADLFNYVRKGWEQAENCTENGG